MSGDARPSHPNATTETSNFGTIRATYNNVKPVELSELQHRFIDKSLLREAPRNNQHQILPAKTTPPTPVEAAREALVIAFNERESCRIQLNTNYSTDGALEFDEKAKIYNMRREELAELMPQKALSGEDDISFPWLSTKDTVEPQVCESIYIQLQRIFD